MFILRELDTKNLTKFSIGVNYYTVADITNKNNDKV